jgi:hypothetical protein
VALLRRLLPGGCAAALAACLVVGPARAEQRTATAEDDIKSAFLYNFTKFVEWPPASASEPFRVCVVAEPAFGAAVDRTIAGESAGGRPLLRVTPATPEAARACQILFLGRMENDRVERWIAAVRDAPVLVVGESRAAWDHGAHITFVLDDNRVRFDVNADAAARAGLSVSSKLLRVARNVTARRSA